MTLRTLDHSEFLARIEAFVAGGIGDERDAFLAHRDSCPTCAAALVEARVADQTLSSLFEFARPRDGFEDRLVERLRFANHQPDRRLLHPAVRRVAVGVAAAILIVAIGYEGDLYLNPAASARLEARSIGSTNSRYANERLDRAGQPLQTAALSTPESLAGLLSDRLRGESSEKYLAAGFEKNTSGSGEPAAGGSAGAADPKLLILDSMMGPKGRKTQWGEKPAAGAPSEMPGTGKPLAVTTNVPDSSGAPAEEKDSILIPTVDAAGTQGGGAGGVAASPGIPANGPAAAPAPDPIALHLLEGDAKPKSVSTEVALSKMRGIDAAVNGRVAQLSADASSSPQAMYYRLVDGQGAHKNEAESLSTSEFAAKIGESGPRENKVGLKAAKGDIEQTIPPAETSRQADESVGKDLRQKVEVAFEKPALQTAQGQEAAQKQAELTDVKGDGPQSPAPPPPATAAPEVKPLQSPVEQTRKIIRNGEMTFEVDSFDTAYLTIARIAQEELGFVSTTDSEKLANGKVKGSVIVRCAPEHLDTLVLKLRALGELKNSKINAQDITKQFTDLEAQLRAAKTMEDRLLEIVKKGTATKDLLEAEKQLGVWREKIERLQGEINYYKDQVSLSTLTLTLMERDIRHAALLEEREQVQMNVETEDVEKARNSAIQTIDEAKGRIVQSELRRHDADQFTAVIVADVAPDAAPAVIDRLKQIGRVSRLEIERKQTVPGGGNVDANNIAIPPLPNAKVERKDTRLSISLYNLANIEPRQTTSLNLAAEDVEKAYHAVLDEAKSAGGRVVTSQLVRPRPDTTTGTIVFEAPTDKADAVLALVRGAAELMRLDVQLNPDTQNTTDAKRKFVVQIVSLASVAAREATQLIVATRKVSDSFAGVRDAVREAQGRVLSSQISQANNGQFSATADLTFEVPREGYAVIDKRLTDAGQVVSRMVTRSNDAQSTVDSKVRLQIRIVDEAQLNPGETVNISIAAANVNAQFSKLLEAIGAVDARILDSKLNEAEKENVNGSINFELRRSQRASVEKALVEAGDVISRNVDRTHGTPESTLEDKLRFAVTLQDADRLAPRQTVTLGMESDDVDKTVSEVRDAILAAGGRTVSAELAKERNGKTIAHVVADVPLDKALTVLAKVRDEGLTTSRQDSQNPQVPDGKLARMRIDLTIDNGSRLVEADQTFWSTIKHGLSTGISGLLNALYYLVVGIFFVLPIVLLVWLIARIIRRSRRTTMPRTPAPPSAPLGPTAPVM